ATASETLTTTAPLPAAATAKRPSGVTATSPLAPAAPMVRSSTGPVELSLRSIASPLPVETNEYWPSGVTPRPNGLPPIATLAAAIGRLIAVAVAVLHRGRASAAA